MDNKVKIEFAPGCFDNFTGTQEELDQLVEEITRAAEDGSLFENAEVVDESELDSETLEQITNALAAYNQAGPNRKLH